MSPKLFAAFLSVALIEICRGGPITCDSSVSRAQGEIYYSRWEDTGRNCSWTFNLPASARNGDMLLLKFVHLRYMSDPGLILPDGVNAKGVVGRHLYIDTASQSWCGIYASPALSRMTSCEARARDFCQNGVSVSGSWPPVLQATGSRTIFLATYLYLGCGDGADGGSSVQRSTPGFPWRELGIVLVVVVLLLLLGIGFLAWKIRKGKVAKLTINKGANSGTLLSAKRRTLGKTTSSTALITRDRATSNSDAVREMNPIPEVDL